MTDLLFLVLMSFVTIFLIMDPFPSLITFLRYTKNHSDKERRACATRAVLIAGLIAILFLFLGQILLDLMQITLSDFKIAGGIVIALLGIETVLGINLGNQAKSNLNDLAVLIATPLLTGPGVVTSIIVLSRDNGILTTLIALLLALFVCWVLFIYSISIRKAAGEQKIEIISRVVGLLLVALGVSFVKQGLIG